MSQPKEEFETTSEYQKRMAAAMSRPLFGSVMLNSPIGISAGTALYQSTYNADEGILTVTAYSVIGHNERSYLKSVERSSGAYQGTTGLGTKVEVYSRRSDNYFLVLGNLNSFSFEPGGIDVKLTIKRDEAKRVEPNVRLLFVVRLVPPLLQTEPFRHEPIITLPYDLSGDDHLVLAHLLEVWVYDKSNGRILAKVKPPVSRPSSFLSQIKLTAAC